MRCVRRRTAWAATRLHTSACICTVADVSAAVPADAFAILADPTRRRLVEVLHGGERSVGELVEAVAIAQPGVSRHLRILHEAGFVTARADGQRRLYSLRPQALTGLQAWMRRYAHAESDRVGRLAAFLDGPDAGASASSPSKPRSRRPTRK